MAHHRRHVMLKLFDWIGDACDDGCYRKVLSDFDFLRRLKLVDSVAAAPASGLTLEYEQHDHITLSCSQSMEAESQFSLDSIARPHRLATISIQNGDPGVLSSTTNSIMPHEPASKKSTRQCAAWTHQEEESFFNALRQVGKVVFSRKV
ncbi:hypothetical protein L6164_014880 [Bauhinia variegata]|uniref:Uncharacterized protein n=1 Tax=Bauhinia variegata TaxID=167791 RepID=A0ACB9NIK8_BAUVA|nr:hypothetical protein L6164_014880 [Bauhinia variegata]